MKGKRLQFICRRAEYCIKVRRIGTKEWHAWTGPVRGKNDWTVEKVIQHKYKYFPYEEYAHLQFAIFMRCVMPKKQKYYRRTEWKQVHTVKKPGRWEKLSTLKTPDRH